MGDDCEICESDTCGYMSVSRDCDGDYFHSCYANDSCPYQKNVRDCDGDIITLCTR